MDKEIKGFLESLGISIPILFIGWIMASIITFIVVIKAILKYIIR